MLTCDDAAETDEGCSPGYRRVSVPGMLRYMNRVVEHYPRVSVFHQMWQLVQRRWSGVVGLHVVGLYPVQFTSMERLTVHKSDV